MVTFARPEPSAATPARRPFPGLEPCVDIPPQSEPGAGLASFSLGLRKRR